MTSFRMNLPVVIAALAMLAMQSTDAAVQPSPRPSEATVRVGVFDSRAVAIAYYRSEEFKALLANLHAEHGKAKAAGDDKRAKQLENRGRALNELAHKQGFGTGSVHGILAKIQDDLAVAAKAANVDVIVSKWDIAFQRQGATFVDVTDRIVKPFHPNEATLKVIHDIRKKQPVSENSDGLDP